MASVLANVLRHKVAVLGGVGAVVLGLFGWLILAQPSVPDRLLFGGVAPADLASMGRVLDGAGIAYRLSSDGGSVMVGEGNLGRARMLVAAEGLPKPGPDGYELMDRSQALGSTQFRDEITYLRALEGELARSVGSLHGVRAAKVHIVMPRREPFSRDWAPPTASVLLTLASPAALGPDEAAAVRYLVASAVPRLKIEDVSIIDNFGNLLARPSSGAAAELDGNDRRRVALEDRLARAIEQQLTPITGGGRVRAQVRADIDFSTRRSVEEAFDPLSQVARSSQTQTDRETTSKSDPAVSVEQDLPEAAGKPAASGTESSRETSRDTTNYELSSTRTEHVVQGGELKRLSISLAVDGVCSTVDGATECRPRSDEELAQLERLAKATAGYSADRGDTFEIASMPFSALQPSYADELPVPAPARLSDLLRDNLPLVVIAVVALLAIGGGLLLVLRRAHGQRTAAEARAAQLEADAARLAAAAPPAIGSAARPAEALQGPEDGAGESGHAGTVSMGRGSSPSGVALQERIERARALVESSPDTAVALLKSWLHEKREAR